MSTMKILDVAYCSPDERDPDSLAFLGYEDLFLVFQYQGENVNLRKGDIVYVPTTNQGIIPAIVVDYCFPDLVSPLDPRDPADQKIAFEARGIYLSVPRDAIVSLMPGDLVQVQKKESS